METISLSQALPREDDRNDLTEGLEFAISGIVLEEHGKEGKRWKSAKINGFKLPALEEFVKYKSGAGVVVRQCGDLLVTACFADGTCKKPVRVRVEGRDGLQGRYLILVDA